MPISTLPGERRRFWLRVDEDTPADQRPYFECAAPTRATMMKHRQLVDEAAALKEGPEAYRLIHEAAALGVKGWGNLPEPFDASRMQEQLDAFLSDGELVELATGWPGAFALSESERQSFLSRQSSDAAASAETVTPPEDASTRRPKKSRS